VTDDFVDELSVLYQVGALTPGPLPDLVVG
jgi:hypothetical protein